MNTSKRGVSSEDKQKNKYKEGVVKMESGHIQKPSQFITCSASLTYLNGKFFHVLDGRGRGADEKLSLLTKHREVSTAR